MDAVWSGRGVLFSRRAVNTSLYAWGRRPASHSLENSTPLPDQTAALYFSSLPLHVFKVLTIN